MLRFTILVFLATAYGQQVSGGGDLESVIKEIFGTSEPPKSGSQTDSNPGANTPFVPVTEQPDNRVNQASTLVPGVVTDSGDTSCTTDTGVVGECVRYYLCDDKNNTVITDGIGIIDIRVRDGPCPSYLDTCCLVPNKLPIDMPITPTPPKSDEVRQGCGWRNVNGVGMRIKGDTDNEAKFGEFPWMVAILKIEPVNENEPDGQQLNVYVGGGSLIHPNVVLTAAHYVAVRAKLRVRAGEWDTQTKNEIYPYQDRDVNEVVVHKDFNKGNLFYDIALLFLSSPIDMTVQNVGVVCLPPPGQRAIAGTRCQASGWGKDQFGKEGRYQVILKRVEVPIVDRSTCQEQLRKTRLGRHFELHSSFMCAGGERGKDTCRGDGGSPLVCPIQGTSSTQNTTETVTEGDEEYDLDVRIKYENDRYVQNGIVAWGIGCGEDGTPGVYVDVANLRSWIDDKIAGHGYDPRTYSS